MAKASSGWKDRAKDAVKGKMRAAVEPNRPQPKREPKERPAPVQQPREPAVEREPDDADGDPEAKPEPGPDQPQGLQGLQEQQSAPWVDEAIRRVEQVPAAATVPADSTTRVLLASGEYVNRADVIQALRGADVPRS